MTCSQCYHDNYTSNPLDDLEASCGCDCHESVEDYENDE